MVTVAGAGTRRPQGRVVGAWSDPVTGRWLFTTEKAVAQVSTPPLDGQLLANAELIGQHAGDLGNMVFGGPSAVLLPGSVDDVATMVRFCANRQIPVAARGEKHTTYGQGLAPHGLAIDMRALNQIHHVDQTSADVDAGVIWHDLVVHADTAGARFPALTGYLRLTVGGTLSVGGISPAYKLGAQVDLVDELQVVTGTGDVVWCSRQQEPGLFLSALAGLGQVGVITRARLRMTATPPAVRLHLLDYAAAQAADAFTAMRLICDRGQADELYCMILPAQDETGPVYRLFVTEFLDGTPAENLFDDLPEPGARQHQDMPFLDYAVSNDVMIDAIRADGTWDRLRKPWFDAFLPEEHVTSFMTSVVARMTTADFSPGTGFVLVFPHNADGFTCPRLRVPSDTKRVYLCDVLSTDALDEGPQATFPSRALARNASWAREAQALGGFTYPVGAHRRAPQAWSDHYGSTWQEVRLAKSQWDPAGVLTPGPGIGRASAVLRGDTIPWRSQEG